MSDRVRFLTWNDTVTTANSSGANGFPTPFLGAGAGAYPYPVAVPLSKCLKWFWRAKVWAMATDASVTAGSVTAAFGGLGAGAINSSGFLMTNELEHVAQGINGPGNFSESVGDGTGGTSGLLDLIMFTEFFVGSTIVAPSIVKDSGSFYPLVRITGGLSAIDSGTGDSGGIGFSSNPADLTPTGSIVGTIDGINIPIYYQNSTVSGAATFNFTRMDFTISGYWPYAAKDGSPIYDDATGAQLQDPTN